MRGKIEGEEGVVSRGPKGTCYGGERGRIRG